MGKWLHACIAGVLLVVQLGVCRCDDAGVALERLRAWVTANGGSVNEVLKSSEIDHAGLKYRGVIAEKGVWGMTSLFHIPRKLWIELDHFPEVVDVPLAKLAGCKLDQTELYKIKLAAALALELRKGNASFYHVYFNTLPTLAEFRTFHPHFMHAALLSDFKALPLVAAVRKIQAHDEDLKSCFDAWKRGPDSKVAGLAWDEMLLGLSWLRTRGHDSGSGQPIIIPASDLLNTEKEDKVNVVVQVNYDDFTVRTSWNGLAAGQELYVQYCSSCDNSQLLSMWGIYLEDNSRDLDRPKGHVDCGPRHPVLAKGHSATSKHAHTVQIEQSLRSVAESVLDFGSLSAAESGGWTAPRCKAAALDSVEQGALRCSLARLAWEYCAQEWGHNGRMPLVNSAPANMQSWGHNSPTVEASGGKLPGKKTALSHAEVAAPVNRSFVPAVDSSLLLAGRRSGKSMVHKSNASQNSFLSA